MLNQVKKIYHQIDYKELRERFPEYKKDIDSMENRYSSGNKELRSYYLAKVEKLENIEDSDAFQNADQSIKNIFHSEIADIEKKVSNKSMAPEWKDILETLKFKYEKMQKLVYEDQDLALIATEKKSFVQNQSSTIFEKINSTLDKFQQSVDKINTSLFRSESEAPIQPLERYKKPEVQSIVSEKEPLKENTQTGPKVSNPLVDKSDQVKATVEVDKVLQKNHVEVSANKEPGVSKPQYAGAKIVMKPLGTTGTTNNIAKTDFKLTTTTAAVKEPTIDDKEAQSTNTFRKT